jgi:branched-chain amino acid transport system ATP-binding protein
MLRVTNLRSGYGALIVLDAISLRVEAGEVVALLGANGAGKTTLLKTIAGLITPREGRILLKGKAVSGWSAERIAAAGLTLVPEGRGLFPQMSVLDNLRMGGYARRLRGRELQGRVARSCELFPVLSDRLVARAGDLSGGQQQMLALARALVGGPDLLLLDEPTAGLAPLLVAEVFAKVAQLKQAGVTLLLAAQNVQQALQVADRAYVLENGRIVLTGTGAELMDSEEVQRAYLGI